jgi:hypothetical protein
MDIKPPDQKLDIPPEGDYAPEQTTFRRKIRPGILRKIEQGAAALPHGLGVAMEGFHGPLGAVGTVLDKNFRVGDKYETVIVTPPPEHLESAEVIVSQPIQDISPSEFVAPPALPLATVQTHQHHHHRKMKADAAKSHSHGDTKAADPKAADAKTKGADPKGPPAVVPPPTQPPAQPPHVPMDILVGSGETANQRRATELTRITGAQVRADEYQSWVGNFNKDSLFVEIPHGVDAARYREGFNKILKSAVPGAADVKGLERRDGKQGFYITNMLNEGAAGSLHTATAWSHLQAKQGEFASLAHNTHLLSAQEVATGLSHMLPAGTHIDVSNGNLTLSTPGIKDRQQDHPNGQRLVAGLGKGAQVSYGGDSTDTGFIRNVSVPFDQNNTVGDLLRIQSAYEAKPVPKPGVRPAP